MIPAVTDALNVGLATLFNSDATLLALAPGKAWKKAAPPSATPTRCVIWNVPPAQDRHTFRGGGHVEVTVLVKVEEVAQDAAAVAAAYARAHALLIGETLAVSGWTVMGVQRIAEIDDDTGDTERRLVTVGGEYRVWLTPAV